MAETKQDEQNANITELDECKKQADEYLNNWKRERADFVNYKKEEGKRVEELVKFANEGLILELLDIIEESIIARSQMPKEIEEKYPEWLAGIDGVRAKGFEFLKRHGVERIKTVGEKFDPMLHESVGEMPPASATPSLNASEACSKATVGESEPEMVAEEVNPGFTLHERVIKPARVKITK